LTLADSSRRDPPCLWDLGLRRTSAGRSTCCIRSRPLGCSLRHTGRTPRSGAAPERRSNTTGPATSLSRSASSPATWPTWPVARRSWVVASAVGEGAMAVAFVHQYLEEMW